MRKRVGMRCVLVHVCVNSPTLIFSLVSYVYLPCLCLSFKITQSLVDHLQFGQDRNALWKIFVSNDCLLFFVNFSAEDAVEKKRMSSDSSRGVSVDENGVPEKKHEVSIS